MTPWTAGPGASGVLSTRRPRLAAALSCLAVLALSASCSDDPAEPVAAQAGDGGAAAVADATGDGERDGDATTALVQPLTGEEVDGDLPAHPVLAVKIDNTAASAPQVGLSGADLITEELVEGGLTRLAVMFYSDLPRVAGPVRSMRASDIGIAAPAGATMVASGGAPPTVRRIVGADVATATESEGNPGYTRAGDREVPHNLMVALPELAASLADASLKPPPAYLPFGANPMTGGEPARAFEVAFTPGQPQSWRFDGTSYTRPGSFAERGDDFAADSVLVLRVRLTDAGYKDPAGNPVPETILDGNGEATLFHDGMAVDGSWRKDGLEAPLELVDTNGDALTVPAGHTWIELVPVDGSSVRVSR